MARKRDRRPPLNTPEKSAVSGTLRVIGGALRGRPIAYSGDPGTRPMKQRVREAAFNLLGPQVAGTHVIDLFAGTGALAWEALSRGAARATLIERHFPTARLIRENAASLGLTDRMELIPGDTFIWGKRLSAGDAPGAPASTPWLVFCSPPYELYVSHLPSMLELLQTIVDSAPSGSLVVVEADDRFQMTLLPSTYEWDIREYPPAVLALGQRLALSPPSSS